MKRQEGQTLLEILLAFSVSILVLSAVILSIITSLNNTQYTKNQGLANSYAQEGMAVVRKIRDSTVKNFSDLENYNPNTRYCIDQNSTDLGVPISALNCGQNVGIFSREVRFNHSDASCSGGSKATVTVSWTDNKCPIGTPLCHSVQLITCFSSIDLKPTP